MPKGPPIGVGRTAEVYAWGEGQVLKLYRAGMPAGWVRREAEVGRIVFESGLDAPAVGEVVEVDGRLGVVYERVDGPSMLEVMSRRPWAVFRLARTFAEIQVRMHNCARPELPSGRESLIRAIRQAPVLADDLRACALRRLDELPDGHAVCHGDLHPDNVVMSRRGPIVIDWMTATQGNPVADVARTTVLVLGGAPPPGMSWLKRALIPALRQAFYSAYLRRYLELRPFPKGQIGEWLPVMAAARLNEGIAAEQEALLRRAEACRRPGS